MSGVTKYFVPEAVAAYRIVRQFEQTQILTQILTGQDGLSEYLHRFKCKESPSCIFDPEVNETVLHIIAEYLAFSLER